MSRVKGFSIGTVVLILAIAIGVVGLVYLIGRGLGWGGGKGNDEGTGNAEVIPVEATVITTTEAITTQEMAYIEVTVSENQYIFNNKTYEIEEIDSIISDMRSNLDNFTVEITDDYASLKAYEELISALKNEEIEFIEINNEGE